MLVHLGARARSLSCNQHHTHLPQKAQPWLVQKSTHCLQSKSKTSGFPCLQEGEAAAGSPIGASFPPSSCPVSVPPQRGSWCWPLGWVLFICFSMGLLHAVGLLCQAWAPRGQRQYLQAHGHLDPRCLEQSTGQTWHSASCSPLGPGAGPLDQREKSGSPIRDFLRTRYTHYFPTNARRLELLLSPFCR